MNISFGKFSDITSGPQFGNRIAEIFWDGGDVGVLYAERNASGQIQSYYAQIDEDTGTHTKTFIVLDTLLHGYRWKTAAEAKVEVKE